MTTTSRSGSEESRSARNVPTAPAPTTMMRIADQGYMPTDLETGQHSCGFPGSYHGVMDLGSPESVSSSPRAGGYLPDQRIAQVVYLAATLEKPVLVEGPAGVGKTELAKAVAAATDRRLIRLQCYEGLDEAKALYEWNYKKQLLRIQ